MNSWSPERTKKFAAVAVLTLVVLGVLWQMGIGSLQNSLQLKRKQIETAQTRLDKAERDKTLGPKYRAELQAAEGQIEAFEKNMAHGDLLRWVVNHVLDLQDRYNVEVATSFQSPRVTDTSVPPSVPYRTATYSISGTGHYHDFGAFLAAFENSSPFIRLKGLTLQASAPGAIVNDPERLSFQIDFSTLVSTNALAP